VVLWPFVGGVGIGGVVGLLMVAAAAGRLCRLLLRSYFRSQLAASGGRVTAPGGRHRVRQIKEMLNIFPRSGNFTSGARKCYFLQPVARGGRRGLTFSGRPATTQWSHLAHCTNWADPGTQHFLPCLCTWKKCGQLLVCLLRKWLQIVKYYWWTAL
jgi:hypothetical protein